MRKRGEILKELVESCLEENLKATHNPIKVQGTDYYVTVEIRKQFRRCTKCGQIIKEK